MNKFKIICRALVIDNQNRVLFVKKTGSDFWSLPGGKLDAEDQCLQDCLKRELREELGVEITIKDIRFVQELHKDDTRYVELIWQAALEGDLTHEDIYKTSDGELTDIQWIKQDELGDANVKPAFLKELSASPLSK
ncbi:MAG TPA: NUDIX hydrolase [Ktedonobacteraceae bacterium]|nr:NUDIX hydrolase [Ktedonobacteraceae bacterium]